MTICSDGFPVRTEDDQTSIRIRLAELRGTLTVRQITELERHERILADYEHLLCVYLAPHRFLDLSGLDPAARNERLAAVQKAALATLLPTERDTLAGALRTLTTSLSTVVQLKRLVAGLSENPGRNRNGSEAGERARPSNPFDRDPPGCDLEALDTETLRMIQRAMEALTGHQQRRSDPPMPPPPESLEDFRGLK